MKTNKSNNKVIQPQQTESAKPIKDLPPTNEQIEKMKGGVGKATFKEFTVKKITDQA